MGSPWAQANAWSLVSLDPEVDLRFSSSQPITGWEEEKPPNLSSTSTLGSRAPAVQWASGGQRVVSVSSALVADDYTDDLRPRAALLASLNEADPVLGRAPRVRLTWGQLTIAGFARVSLKTTTHMPSGSPLRVEIDLDITEAEPPGTAPATGETVYRALREGETFESLAADLLGDPLKGDLIRRTNPAIAGAPETPGVRVKVLEALHPLMRGRPSPVSPAFQGATWRATLDALALDLGGDTPGRSWAAVRAQLGV